MLGIGIFSDQPIFKDGECMPDAEQAYYEQALHLFSKSNEAEQAASIVWELTMFWEYLNRVFELPHAKSIIEWLKTDGMAANLEAELSDSTNFGLAKSIFMSGKNAGYDMTSEKGMAEFIAAYNLSLLSGTVSTPATNVSGRQRIGCNDPCPCGSGKKFKKCCR